MSAPLYCALVHHPVRDRAGETVTTAVTTLDIHDIARSACTYGLAGYFIVTPIDAQHVLVGRVLGHWDTGGGRQRMPERSRALALCRPVHTLAEVSAAIAAEHGRPPKTIATAARQSGRTATGFDGVRERLAEDPQQPWLLLFGTGHGLVDGVLAEADVLLSPIVGVGDYNHLSVRSAAAICFDRLLGGTVTAVR